jgi:hypothetical protein
VFKGVHLTHRRAPQAVAVRTQNWNRPENIALARGPGFKEAVEKTTKPLPEATAKITKQLVFLVFSVASRPRFGGDSQVLSWYRPAEMKPSWVETSWKGSAGQGPARPKGSSYVYKYQGVTQVDSRQ